MPIAIWILTLTVEAADILHVHTQTPQMMKGKLQKQSDCSALIIPNKKLQDRVQMLHWTLLGQTVFVFNF